MSPNGQPGAAALGIVTTWFPLAQWGAVVGASGRTPARAFVRRPA